MLLEFFLTKRHFQLREVFVLLPSFEEQMGVDCADLVICAASLGSRPCSHLQNSELYSPVSSCDISSGEWWSCFSSPRGSFVFCHHVYCSVVRFMCNQQSSFGVSFVPLHNFCFSTYFFCFSVNRCLYFRCPFWLGLEAHSSSIQHLLLEAV